MQVCFGGCCIPLDLLIPAILGGLGYCGVFRVFDPTWFSVRAWKHWWLKTEGEAELQACDAAVPAKAAEGSDDAAERVVSDGPAMRTRRKQASCCSAK